MHTYSARRFIVSNKRIVISNNSERSKELRSAANLLFDAFATPDSGMAIALAFMSMEAILLESSTTDNVTARLSEAVAYRIGKSADKRRDLRQQVKKLYKLRSSFVHTGQS
jgi:Apea-like HEPN